MNKCHQCAAQTDLYENGVPLCLKCRKRRETGLRKPPAREEPREKPLKKIERGIARVAGALGFRGIV